MRRRPYSSWAHRFGVARCFLRGAPVWCTWQVTYRCPLRCQFCDYWRRRVPRSEELSPADFARGARNLGRLGSLFVSLAGGEPLVRSDLEEVIAAVARRHVTFMTTCGYGLSAERARALWEAGLWGASVSIDYADPQRHDAARGRSGAFDHALRALQHLSDTRNAWFQQVNLLVVLMHDNLDQLDRLAALALDCRANLMVQPYSPAKTGCDDFLPRAPVTRRLMALKRRWPNFLSTGWFLARFDDYLNGGVPGCAAGVRFFNIDHHGRLSRCVEEMDHPVGSLLEEPIGTLLRRLRRRRSRARDTRHPLPGIFPDCRACWYNCRGEVEALQTVRGLLEELPTYLIGPWRSRWSSLPAAEGVGNPYGRFPKPYPSAWKNEAGPPGAGG